MSNFQYQILMIRHKVDLAYVDYSLALSGLKTNVCTRKGLMKSISPKSTERILRFIPITDKFCLKKVITCKRTTGHGLNSKIILYVYNCESERTLLQQMLENFSHLSYTLKALTCLILRNILTSAFWSKFSYVWQIIEIPKMFIHILYIDCSSFESFK